MHTMIQVIYPLGLTIIMAQYATYTFITQLGSSLEQLRNIMSTYFIHNNTLSGT